MPSRDGTRRAEPAGFPRDQQPAVPLVPVTRLKMTRAPSGPGVNPSR
jgi:hypothetical protein